jgi:hypothetical protein
MNEGERVSELEEEIMEQESDARMACERTQ